MKLLHDHSRHFFHTQRRRASGQPEYLIARAGPAQPLMAITGHHWPAQAVMGGADAPLKLET